MCSVIKHTALVCEGVTAGSVKIFKSRTQIDLL